ncbi:MAG TPA: hypothetical protein VN704_00075 [Verrucomicrobiae bacterium]|nr:hypothetical protein [Verrucomicrobiae bacterium]
MDTIDETIIKREQLAVISARIDVQKKRLELKSAKLDYQFKKTKQSLETINDLRYVLTTQVVIPESNLYSSETKYKNALSNSQQIQVINKMMALLVKL